MTVMYIIIFNYDHEYCSIDQQYFQRGCHVSASVQFLELSTGYSGSSQVGLLQWSLRTTDTLGGGLLSVVERCPYLGD